MKRSFINKFYLISIAILLFESAMLKIIFFSGSYFLGAAAHVAIVFALAKWCKSNTVSDKEYNIILLLFVTTTILGPFGAAGSIITISLYSRSASPFKEWYETLFPKKELNYSSMLYNKIKIEQKKMIKETRVESFMDLVTFGSLQQKRDAIFLMEKNFYPPFASAILMALNGNNNTLRVQAATAISNIEKRFFKRSLELHKAIEKTPKDLEVIYALAEHYDDHAYTGLLDREREKYNREKALEGYQNYINLKETEIKPTLISKYDKKDEKARIAVCRILLGKGLFKKTEEILEHAITKGYKSSKIILLYMESQYRLCRYSEVRKLAKTYFKNPPNKNDFPLPILEAVQLWSKY